MLHLQFKLWMLPSSRLGTWRVFYFVALFNEIIKTQYSIEAIHILATHEIFNNKVFTEHKTQSLSCEGKCHGCWVLEVWHDHGGDGEHETRHDLLGVVIVLGVSEADAGTVHSHPATPLDSSKHVNEINVANTLFIVVTSPHHESTHREYHAEDVHVIRSEVIVHPVLLLLASLGCQHGLGRGVPHDPLRPPGIWTANTWALHLKWIIIIWAGHTIQMMEATHHNWLN